MFSQTFLLALHSTTEFFVFQQSFYVYNKTIAGRRRTLLLVNVATLASFMFQYNTREFHALGEAVMSTLRILQGVVTLTSAHARRDSMCCMLNDRVNIKKICSMTENISRLHCTKWFIHTQR